MKPCKTCGQVKPLAEFPANKQMRDGRRNECKACTKAYIRAWRDGDVERLRAKDREYARQPHVRAATAVRNTAWRFSNRTKARAQQLLNHALKRGTVKPQPCWVCGERAEAHHPDYSTPLDVVWLCRPHHKQAHALIQGEAHAENRRND